MMWYSNRNTKKQETTPNITAFLQSAGNKEVLTLHIKNIGKECAKHVKAKMMKEYHIWGKEETIFYFKILFEGGNIFSPNYKLHFYLDFWSKIRQECRNGCVELGLEYFDIERKRSKKNSNFY